MASRKKNLIFAALSDMRHNDVPRWAFSSGTTGLLSEPPAATNSFNNVSLKKFRQYVDELFLSAATRAKLR
jgi:hypothetical protein